MRILRELVSISVFSILILSSCSSLTRWENDSAVEKLRERLVNGRFEEIYRDASDATRAQLPKDEFIGCMKDLADDLRTVDPQIAWHRDEMTLFDASVFREDNFSALELKVDGKKKFIQIDWAENFRICAISTFSDQMDGGNRIFRNCD